MDLHSRPELLHGTVDFPVSRDYWFPQPPPSGSLIDSVLDSSSANLAGAGDALATTGADLLGALQNSLGQTPTRGSTPQPASFKEREKERKKEERRLRKPVPLGRVFIIDVSAPCAGRGIVREVCEAVKQALYGDEENSLGPGERIAIMTVAETVGFWNLAVSFGGLAELIQVIDTVSYGRIGFR